MRVVCSKCGYQFESLIIDRGKALNDIEVKSTRHCKEKHGEVFGQVVMAVQISTLSLSRLIHFNEFMVVPEEEDFVLEQLERAQEVVALAAGFDEVEEENDDLVGDQEIQVDEDETDDVPEIVIEPTEEMLGGNSKDN